MFEKLNLRFKKKKFDKENDVSRVKTDEFNLPLVNAKDGENGVMYYGRSQDFESAEMTIDIVNDGAISTGNVYSQPQKTGVLYNAYLVKPKFSANEKLLHFFTSTIEKSIKFKFGYENKAGWAKVQEEKIQLPTKNGEIDFEFMESFIAELEAERVEELEAYLVATGLKDYTLTAEEERVLAEFESGKFTWGEFRIGELFEINPTKYYRLQNEEIISENGNVALVSNSSTDNGVMGFSNFEPNNKGNTMTCSDTTLGADTMFYQKNDFIGYSHIQHLVPKSELFNKAVASVIITASKISTSKQYDYGNKFNRVAMNNTKIQLPTQNNQPNCAIMETFISAIQKIVIKDVVIYADKKIAATKSVVERKG